MHTKTLTKPALRLAPTLMESIILLNSKFRKLINNVVIYQQVCYLSANPQITDHLFHKNNLKPVNHYFSAKQNLTQNWKSASSRARSKLCEDVDRFFRQAKDKLNIIDQHQAMNYFYDNQTYTMQIWYMVHGFVQGKVTI